MFFFSLSISASCFQLYPIHTTRWPTQGNDVRVILSTPADIQRVTGREQGSCRSGIFSIHVKVLDETVSSHRAASKA